MPRTHARRAGAIAPAAECVEPFDGFPYLVTRIGRTALRHIAIVPAGWPRERLVDLLRRQVRANQLETCLCLGPGKSVFLDPNGEPCDSDVVPTGIPVTDRLVVAGPIRGSAEQTRRRETLRAHVDRHPASGYIVGDGLEGGRLATDADVVRLSAKRSDGLPPGLRRCPACAQARGEFLALRGEGNLDRRPRVVDVHCSCTNHNRCAGCGEPLAERRLSAYFWDEERSGVTYVAAYVGLGHECA